MARLIWSPRALRDVERFYDFLAPNNPEAADRAAETIDDGVQALSVHPEIGRPYEDTDLREWFIPFGSGGYFVLYRYDRNVVMLLALRHSRELGFGS